MLTAKQEAFARAIALEGLNQSDAYRLAYNLAPDSLPDSTWQGASHLAADVKVRARIAELKASLQAESVADAASLVRELLTVGNVQVDPRSVRAADKVAALDKVAKILGLYRDPDSADTAPRAVITNITVVLDHRGSSSASAAAAKPVIEGQLVNVKDADPLGLDAPEP